MGVIKKNPKQQLEKFSTVFMQLGLVLVLFITYVVIEHKTEKQTAILESVNSSESEILLMDDRPVIFKRSAVKPKVVVKRVVTPKPTDLSKIDKRKNVKKVVEEFVKNTDTEPVVVNPDDIKTVEINEEIDKKDDEKLGYSFVEVKPVFRGCEGLNNAENKKCFDKKMKRLIQRYFDTDLANELGLQSGKHRISTQFVIDKDGEVVDVKIRAPHKLLVKEVKDIVAKIPTFTPGKQNNKPVKVQYTLPITFKVE